MKTAFITGGNRGIGLETARQLGKLGYSVIIGCRDLNKAKQAAESLHKDHSIHVDYIAIDIEDDDSVAAAAKEVGNRCHGKLDVLINNAGFSGDRTQGDQVDLTLLRKTLDINLIGTIRVTNHFLSLVKQSSEGRIVNVSSIMGCLQHPVADLSTYAYNASKAALNMYTINLAQALHGTSVKVNSCHPGWVKTDMGGANAPLSVEEGAETSVFLATLPKDGPTGKFYHKKNLVQF